MKHSQAEIEAIILELLREELDVSTRTLAQVGPQSPLLGKGVGLDSVEALLLATGLERRCKIALADEELRGELFQSVARLAEFVRAKQEEEGGED